MPDLARHAQVCVVECEPRLTALLQRSFPRLQMVAAGFPPHPATGASGIGWHAPLGDLAARLRPTLASFPREPAYLRADERRIRAWRERLAMLAPGPEIGLCWRSSNRRGSRALACTGIEQWLPLLREPRACFVNLQYDHCNQELALARDLCGRSIATFPDIDMQTDLDETAALIASLDLVLSAPTTVSVLAAGLGIPTWQLTCGADWHAPGQAGSPWQPQLRRFYRRSDQTWESVIERLTEAFEAWMSEYPDKAGSSRCFSG